MNITFLIGNGFDLHLGMKTKYTDMYDEYIKSPSANEVIKKFKADLKKDANQGYATWGDFEMAMARHAKTYSCEDDFIQCIRDFKRFLASHLQSEQKIFKNQLNNLPAATIFDEFASSLSNFYKKHTDNLVRKIEELKTEGAPNKYGFIVFNYTDILDEIITNYNSYYKTNLQRPIHIHGTLPNEHLLGVDNPEQLAGIAFPISTRLERSFIKPRFNSMVSQERANNALSLIQNSDVICVYGMSFGQSDLTWTTAIEEWLTADSSHHLFYFGRLETEYEDQWLREEILEAEELKKAEMLKRICSSPAEKIGLLDQIHISINYSIFNYKKCIDEHDRDLFVRELLAEEKRNRSTGKK